MSDEVTRVRMTGCWKREGRNGTFFSGYINVDEFMQQLKSLKTEKAQVFVNQFGNKSKDTDPDISITLADDNRG